MTHSGWIRSSHKTLMRLARFDRESELEPSRHCTDEQGNREH